MSQEETRRMLDAVGWANRRLEQFGLGEVVAVVVTAGNARLLSRESDHVYDTEPCEDDAALAVRILMLRMEIGLRVLFGAGDRD